MKHFRRFCFTLVLIAAFAMPALAGEINSPGAPGPGETNGPPAMAPGETHTPPGASVQGEISSPGVAGDILGPGIAGDISTPGIAALLFLITSGL